MAILEAMSYGIPCISSDCMSGPRDMIQSGINGELYSPGVITQYINHLNNIISGKIKYNNNLIPATIEKFYNDVYFENLESIISSKNNK